MMKNVVKLLYWFIAIEKKKKLKKYLKIESVFQKNRDCPQNSWPTEFCSFQMENTRPEKSEMEAPWHGSPLPEDLHRPTATGRADGKRAHRLCPPTSATDTPAPANF